MGKSQGHPCSMEWVSECMKKVHTKSLPEWEVRYQGEGSATSPDSRSCQQVLCIEESTGGQGLSIVVSRERVIGVSRWLKIKEGGSSQCSNVWKVLHSTDLKMQAVFTNLDSCAFPNRLRSIEIFSSVVCSGLTLSYLTRKSLLKGTFWLINVSWGNT